MAKKKKSAVKSWLSTISWKQQTVLFCALRGPDIGGSPEVKLMVRWIRSVVLENAAPGKTFMKETEFPDIAQLAEEKPLVFDMLPTHFMGHLLHAFQVIGNSVFIEKAHSKKAKKAYLDLCDYLHVNPESLHQMTDRLADEI